MTNRFTKQLLAALIAGAASLATAYAADPRTMLEQDRYDYTFHNGPRSPYSDGARDTYTEGARTGRLDPNGSADRQTDWMPDGSSHAAFADVPFTVQVAGMDHTGVSAPPDQSGKHAG